MTSAPGLRAVALTPREPPRPDAALALDRLAREVAPGELPRDLFWGQPVGEEEDQALDHTAIEKTEERSTARGPTHRGAYVERWGHRLSADEKTARAHCVRRRPLCYVSRPEAINTRCRRTGHALLCTSVPPDAPGCPRLMARPCATGRNAGFRSADRAKQSCDARWPRNADDRAPGDKGPPNC